ncbi:MAG: eukaryotic-like serine/threonine-protein kinase [Acidobacteriota bacterium]|jgi:serine/threonine-protein kinase|nr:eukaryotic-like serine/threonine-protein kinase [Acidobacteriota bacterium]
MQALLCPSCGTANSEFDSRCAHCGAALPASSATRIEGIPPRPVATEDEPLSGQQISHFRILGRIGRGGMGSVFRALDLELNREVALKFLHAQLEGRPRDQVRFRREAQAAAALDHPNIGTVYEVGESEGRRFIAMALYDGETLAERLAHQPDRKLALPAAVAIAGQLASALETAHAAGLVHRDLKPGNVMILRDGRVKLIDFGLARWADSARVTEQGMAVGTAAYMAPEQLRNQEAGAAADVWALGVVLYEMLAGRHPFGGERQGMVHSILFERPLALREACPEMPAVVETIVERCLAKEPWERPSAGAVVAELQASGLWASSGSGTVVPHLRRQRWRIWAGAAAAVVLLVLAFSAYLLTRKPALPVYVAVLKPEIEGSLSLEDQARVTANIQAALLRTVAALDGLAALGTSQINAVKGSPVAVARAVAAGEVVASRADCAGDLCHVSLQRLGGADGRVLWTEALDVPSSRPRLFADAVAAALRHGYGDRRLRVPRLELDIQDADYQAFFDLKQRMNREGMSSDTLASLDALRKNAPSFLEAYTLEAKVARRLYQDTGEALYLKRGLAVAREALQASPASGNPGPLEALFELDLAAGRLDDAEAVLGQLAEIDPAGSLLQRGLLAKRRGHPQEALDLMHAAIRLQPSWLTLLTVANAEFELSRFDDARRHAEQLLAQSPGNVEGLKMLAQIELLRNPERALTLLREAAKSDPGADSLTNLGVNLMLLRRYGEAEESLRKALALQPENPDPALNLADCLTLLGRETEAHQLYARIAEATSRRSMPNDWHGLSVRAQALAHLGKTDQALDAIQQALRLSPDNGLLAYEAAVVYVIIGDRSSALFHTRRAAVHNVNPNWFAFPFFDPLRNEPAFKLLATRNPT